MPTVYKVLGQVAPAATTDSTLYSCPSSTQAVVSTISVCNRGTTESTYRISVRPDGATLANQHYLAFDALIYPNDTVTLTIGITLDQNDIITVYGSNANLSFSCFGSEIS